MAYTAKQIADFLHGEVVGDPEVTVSVFQRLKRANQIL